MTVVSKSFKLRKKEGVIKDVISGEDFSIFNKTVLDLIETVPEIRGARISTLPTEASPSFG